MELGECLTRLGRYEEELKNFLKSRELYIEAGKSSHIQKI